jgi:hypothetical protein
MIATTRAAIRSSIRSWAPGLLGALMLALSYGVEPAYACYDYCGAPGTGNCPSLCGADFYPWGTTYVEGCGYCDWWVCSFYNECYFGGGCNCSCDYDLYREYCTGYPV